MQAAGDDLLAGARLAANHDRIGRRHDGFDLGREHPDSLFPCPIATTGSGADPARGSRAGSPFDCSPHGLQEIIVAERLVTYSKAPSRIALTAPGIEPCAVTTMIGRAGSRRLKLRSTTSPLRPGIRMSRSTAAGGRWVASSSAAPPPSVSATSNPASARIFRMAQRMSRSSSTIKTVDLSYVNVAPVNEKYYSISKE